ncbi:MAG TPA: putative toxin-antitoxin system toxin component, PIN family [Candidatus Baltobacteraceae bacterium]|nr:putative toxin-antitoxin system toxin component, PIN family [Candidatus Baltobacteraceae bacterium]
MIPLRLVLDTNIVVSAALNPEGPQRTILLLALKKPARLYLSPAILEEYRSVLSRPRLHIRRGLRRRFLQLIENGARLVEPPRRLSVARDTADNIFIECADASGADYLITGNVRDFPRYWKRTKVITSHEFLGLIAPHLLG